MSCWCFYVPLTQILNVKVLFFLLCLNIFINPSCLCSLHPLNFLSSCGNIGKVAYVPEHCFIAWKEGRGNASYVPHLCTEVSGLASLPHERAYSAHWIAAWVFKISEKIISQYHFVHQDFTYSHLNNSLYEIIY